MNPAYPRQHPHRVITPAAQTSWTQPHPLYPTFIPETHRSTLPVSTPARAAGEAQLRPHLQCPMSATPQMMMMMASSPPRDPLDEPARPAAQMIPDTMRLTPSQQIAQSQGYMVPIVMAPPPVPQTLLPVQVLRTPRSPTRDESTANVSMKTASPESIPIRTVTPAPWTSMQHFQPSPQIQQTAVYPPAMHSMIAPARVMPPLPGHYKNFHGIVKWLDNLYGKGTDMSQAARLDREWICPRCGSHDCITTVSCQGHL